MYVLRLSRQFVRDLQSLPKPVQKQANKALQNLERDPYHPGLDSHSLSSIHRRKAMHSKVNYFHRILWEWGEGGTINLWRVGHHDLYKGVYSLPTEAGANWRYYERIEVDGSAEAQHDWRQDLSDPHPFRNVPDNHLRLFGVPEAQLAAVKQISDPEEIWDVPIAENVRYTLYNVLEMAEDWTADHLMDTNQLLFRATADQLEGYCEGNIKQLMLNLNEEQQAYVEIKTNGPLLIKGVAGSGKTTIGLYRANYLADQIKQSRLMFGEDSSILLLTYTETLTKALRQLYSELYGDIAQSITVQSLKKWMLQQLQMNDIWLTEAEWDARSNIISRVRNEVAQIHPRDTVVSSRSITYLLNEIDQVIRARSLASLEDYQTVDRVGRGIGLDRERHRPLMWEIYVRYQQALDERGLFDWADLARLVVAYCAPLPKYDVVIVDEAQDLPPSDLRLATQLLPDYSGNRSLTLLADPAQSIYYRGIPWKEAGINVQGRTRVLAKNYRNTQQILDAARHIVESFDDVKAEGEFVPPTSTQRQGPKPTTVAYSSSSRSNHFLASKIIELCQAGRYRPGDIAVLSRSKNLLTKHIHKYLQQQNIHCRFHRDDEFHVLENEVKLITMHSAKGLEFPVVFLIGLSDQYMPYIKHDSDTELEDEQQERKLFYVSMTRAAERLYLLHPQRNRCRFLYDLDAATIAQTEC